MRISCMHVCDVTSTKGHCAQKRQMSRMNGVSCIPCGMTLPRYIREDERTGRLEGLTAMGRLHIIALRLNRPALIIHRQRRYLAALLEARLEQALAENKVLRERIAQRDLYITYLEERLTERRELE